MLARVIEPTSKLDYDPGAGRDRDRGAARYPHDQPAAARLRAPMSGGEPLARACAGACRAGPARPWCSTTCTTLYFETDEGDGFREPGFSKERRLEPQITVGLLTDARGFPLTVHAFEGNTGRDQDDPAGDPARSWPPTGCRR